MGQCLPLPATHRLCWGRAVCLGGKGGHSPGTLPDDLELQGPGPPCLSGRPLPWSLGPPKGGGQGKTESYHI